MKAFLVRSHLPVIDKVLGVHVPGDTFWSVGKENGCGADPYQGESPVFNVHVFRILDKQELGFCCVLAVFFRS